MPESGQVNEVVPPAPPPMPLEETKPDWATKVFTSLALVALLLLIVVVLIDGTASMMVSDGGGGYSRSSEARDVLGAMKDRARVAYQRNPALKQITFQDLGMNASEFDGAYFKRDAYSCGGTATKWWAQCENVFESEPRHLRVESNLIQGSATYNR